MPLYWPSLVCNFRLRFDETLKISDIPDPLPQAGDVDAISGATPPTTRPLITRVGRDELSQVLNRVPKAASVELPSYRQAGTFSLEFDWRELPIDPRLLRDIGVEIFAGTVSDTDFATGMTRVEADGRRRSILNLKGPSNAAASVGLAIAGRGAGGLPRDDLMLLAGVVDNWHVTHNDSGSIVKIDGRDLRGMFLDSPCDPAMLNKLDLSRSIIDVVKDIISSHPAGQFVNILHHDNDWPQGSPPSPIDKGGLTRVRKGAGGGGSSIGTGSDAPNYWDIITNYCFLVGAVPYFYGRNIRIRPATALYDQSKPTFAENYGPFATPTRIDDSGNPFSIRKMIYGRNIKELSFERKYHGVKVPVIQVNSFDTSSPQRGLQKLLSAQWPPKDEKLARVSGVAPSGEVSQSDIVQHTVEGVRDVGQLLLIAKNLYEEIGRGELGGNCSTSVLSSYKGSNDDPDICRIRPGDAVEFLFDTSTLGSKAPGASTLLDDKRRSFDAQVKEIQTALSGKAGGGDENLARVLVASSRSVVVDMLNIFRVANVVFTWSQTAGLQTKFDFQNFFRARSDINQQLGKNVGNEKITTASNAHGHGKGGGTGRIKTNPKPKVKPDAIIADVKETIAKALDRQTGAGASRSPPAPSSNFGRTSEN